MTGNPFLSLSLRRHQLTHLTYYGSWAMGSLAVSGVAMFFTKGQWHHSAPTNAAWESINLVIATWCLYRAKKRSPALPARATPKKERQFRQFLGVNLGLDLLYLAGGGWLYQLSVGSETNSALPLGFSQATGLQGLVLLSLDTTPMLISLRRYPMSGAVDTDY